ncbi:MAG TPA: acetolactate synthase [Phycisphaerae bacterium]|nr:acetolactate synthase [Phycisphaerae bacterium]HUU21906.1 acetolactate synthase [Phycisphaerae bacterium]
MSTREPLTERGYETPFVVQFSLFLSNRVGRLNQLLEILEQDDVQMAGISVVDSTDWAVVRMVFTAPDKAREVLKRRGIPFTEGELLAIELEDPQTFHKACRALVAAELNLQFAYPLLLQRGGHPVLAFHVDDPVLASQVLIRHGFSLLDHGAV